MSDNKITTKRVSFIVEISTDIPVIEGKTNVNKEVDNMMEAIANEYDFHCWSFTDNGNPKELV